jgi:hypothetical protein
MDRRNKSRDDSGCRSTAAQKTQLAAFPARLASIVLERMENGDEREPPR